MSAEPTVAVVAEETESDKFGDVACTYHAIDACVSAFYEFYSSNDKASQGIAYGLVMAIERLNNTIGRAAGCI